MKIKKNKIKYVISACLLGIPCHWNKKGKIDSQALKVFLKGEALALCPELLAGLPTPRPACEIIGGDGVKVLKGRAKIVGIQGKNYSKVFIEGANKSLKIVKKLGIKKAILKSGSPSCGAVYIYSGDFSGKKIKGKGVFAALLTKNKVKITEKQ